MEDKEAKGRRVIEAPRVLPSSLESERAVLGAVLIDNAVVHLATAHLGAKDFFRDAHRRIFAAIIALVDAGTVADLVTCRNYLEAKGDLDECGGPAYLGSLVDGVPRSSNVADYAAIVKEKAQLRALIFTANKTLAEAYEADQPAAVIARACEDSLTDLSAASDHRETELKHDMSALFRDLERRQEQRGAITGLPTGFPSIDALTLGWQRGDYNIIAARTSMGKSIMALNCAVAAAQAGYRVLLFSLEMSKRRLEIRLLSSLSGVPAMKIRGGWISAEDSPLIANAMEQMRELPLEIYDKRGITAVDVRSLCRHVKAERGLDLVEIDYVQQMSAPPSMRKSATRNEELSETSRRLQVLWGDLNVVGLVAAQLSRGDKDSAREPELSDLRDSGSLEQDADTVGFLHRKDSREGGLTKFIIRKQRDGPTGVRHLTLDRECVRFTDGGEEAAEPAAPTTPKRQRRMW